jgi:hypothetical protein
MQGREATLHTTATTTKTRTQEQEEEQQTHEARFDACWMEEDLMGKLTNMSSKTHARTFVLSVLTRYCCLVSVVDSMTASAKLKKP